MSAEDRFVDFLRRAAAGYHEPPETPREALWSGIESAWQEARVAASVKTEDGEPLTRAGELYHEPPETPREEMWSRIEAAWTLRAAAPAEAREAGLEPLAGPGEEIADSTGDSDIRGPGSERSRRTAWPLWIGVAAALLIGIAIGRQSVVNLGGGSDGRTVAGAPTSPDPGPPDLIADPAVPGPTEGTGAVGVPASREDDGTAPVTRLATADETPAGADDLGAARRRSVILAAATFEHLSRTEAFLTSFRAGDPGETGEDASNDDELARWARGLLADTRLLLDMPVEHDPRFTALLQELELVLAQIAGLGGNALDGERELIMDGLDSQSTLARIRAANASPAAIQTQGA